MKLLLSFIFAFAMSTVVRGEFSFGDSAVDPVKTSLKATASTVKPGSEFYVVLTMKIEKDWHVYWKNPGDSGLKVNIDWQGSSSGLRFGELLFPNPKRYEADGLVSFCHDGEVHFLTKVTVAENIADLKSLSIKANVDWLMCKTTCLPGSATFEQKVALGKKGVLNKDLQLLVKKELKKQPLALKNAIASVNYAKGILSVAVRSDNFLGIEIDKVNFFPLGMDEVSIEKSVTFEHKKDILTIKMVAEEKGSTIRGVLALTNKSGEKFFAIDQEVNKK